MVNNPKTFLSLSILALLPHSSMAVTLFTNPTPTETNFNNAGNWDNGLPDNTNGVGTIAAGATAIMTANYLMSNDGSPSVTDIIVNGSLSTGANELQLRSGGVGRSPDLTVNGMFTVNNGGTIDIAGASADLFLAGGGDMLVESGGTFAASKTVDLGSGSILTFESGALMAASTNDELQLRNGSTIAFQIAGDGSHFTLNGNTLQVRLGTTPNLIIDFASAPTIGNTFDLITGVSDFTDYQGVGSGNTFDPANITVTGLGAGQSYQLDYTNQLQLQIIPEPSSTALLGLGGLALLMRRKK